LEWFFFQLGGPDHPEAVEPFLYNLFCDPDIINFPLAFLARKPLAKADFFNAGARRLRALSGHRRGISRSVPLRGSKLARWQIACSRLPMSR